MAKKMNDFLGHCCFIRFYPMVFLAKNRKTRLQSLKIQSGN